MSADATRLRVGMDMTSRDTAGDNVEHSFAADGSVRAYVCENSACRLPAETVEALPDNLRDVWTDLEFCASGVLPEPQKVIH